jgi:hypothetical protein
MQIGASIRVAGTAIGAIGSVVAAHFVQGLWGYAVGAGTFFGCVSISGRHDLKLQTEFTPRPPATDQTDASLNRL